MKMAGTLIFGIIFIFLISSPVEAESTTNIEIKTNGSSAKSSVNVSNNVQSDLNTTQESKTKIRIESNGQVQEYESDKNEKISLESENGNTKVTVSNKSEDSESEDKIDKSSNSAEKKRAESATKTSEPNAHENFFEKIIDSIKNFFFKD